MVYGAANKANLVCLGALLILAVMRKSVISLRQTLSFRVAAAGKESWSALSSEQKVKDGQLQNSTTKQFRTHKCGELRKGDVGKKVRLSGWLEFNRMDKFFTLRDSTGTCQVLNTPGIKLPKQESILYVEGSVQPRPEQNKNDEMSTGDIEINSSNIQVLNESHVLPYPVNARAAVREELRMKYRYLDLRSEGMQRNLRLRSKLLLDMRKFLCERHGFVDVETPTLFRRTPGGAKEFIVPTRSPGEFYSLPQSPQQFKQLLMAGGVDRYMQVAKCYRDEGAKPDRQPEFTQLDLELSFTNQEEVKCLVEEMLSAVWPESLAPITAPFHRMTFKTAMNSYGSDKPDLRYECLLTDVSSEMSRLPVFSEASAEVVVKAVRVPQGSARLSAKTVRGVQQAVENLFSLNLAMVKVGDDRVWKSALNKHVDENTVRAVNEKLGLCPGDLVFVCAHRDWLTVCQALGKCRTLLAAELEASGTPLFSSDEFKFLWVEDFPLFEVEDGALQSAHHPFTAPVDEDLDLLYTDPTRVRGQHYDLVLNGSEVGGGSIRIHDARLQQYVIESVLREDSGQLSHLIEALGSGCPPHGGIALGLDRLLAIMCNAPSIRDVIAFPKSSLGADLMSGAPCQVDDDDLKMYNISIVGKPKSNESTD